jgi:hypothetical protein
MHGTPKQKLPDVREWTRKSRQQKTSLRDSSIKGWGTTAALKRALEKRWSICAFN